MNRTEQMPKPARITEPGQWGVVRDGFDLEWVNHGGGLWITTCGDGRNIVNWDAIDNPALVRPGIGDE